MRALIFNKPGDLIWQEQKDLQLQGPREAIVRPIASTTCDLDRLILRGEAPFTGPFAIGHECVAEVVDVGEEVRRVRRGDIVVVNWHISCSHCDRCQTGRPNSCRTHQTGAMYGLPGLGDWGGTFSDSIRVIEADFALTKVPIGVRPEIVASAADNLPFAFEFTIPHLRAVPGAEVLVMGGCGSIALYAVMFARAGGASRVVYYDTDPARLDLATHYGAEVVEGPTPRRAGSFPIVIDASAQADSLLCAIRSVEPEGIVSSVGGHFLPVSMPLFDMYRTGVRFYTGRGRGGPNVAETLQWVADGRVDPSAVTSQVAAFDDAPDVLAEPSLKPVLARPPIFQPS
ncbi:putative zinc-binding alcohol dehydrogenase [Candidatus Phycosocius bacilliformis]|uniref:Putative zinc-binding alcohol dehydrogenase n=1 Tax=Candidatus Phycosocius bacilliformis TaxID=1445552 RepID=A0A2P2E9L7_9PROT|nr:alcohol dehydrogenase catalytic domain-containing protein [Candidatus Phycosocius bacilliformis]GBF57759.1 putative zinc-binding alcohol dehydrogenase [Candidatus Phycosocius bacilliformis]